MFKDNLQFCIILALFTLLFCHLYQQGKSNRSEISIQPDTTIVVDTILPAPVIVQLPRQVVPKPQIIYIDSSKTILAPAKVDTSLHQAVQLYQDSLEDENITLYYQSMVKGELLQNALDYTLKVPQQITKTVAITKPVPQPVSSLLLTGSVGTDFIQGSSLRLGLNFVAAQGWSIGYDYDLLQHVHSLNFGLRIVPFKPKKTKLRNKQRNFFSKTLLNVNKHQQ